MRAFRSIRGSGRRLAARRLSLALAIAALPAAAFAQSDQQSAGQPNGGQQSQPASKSASTVQGVTVTSSQNDFRSSPDKRSYDLTKDLQGQTGSLADVLRNIPSLSVDLNGNVSIRGDANIQILVDGKPSGMFKGAGAGQVLLSIPADQYERVEVMTNPSAAYSPEGSGGIINLITKKTRKSGASGSIRVNAGTRGRWGVGVTGAYKGDKLSAQIAGGYRYDPQHPTDEDRPTILDASGKPISTTNQITVSDGPLHIWYLRGGADYALDPKTTLSAEAHYTDLFLTMPSVSSLESFDASGALDRVFTRRAREDLTDRKTEGGSATFRRSFAGDNHDLTLIASYDRTPYDLGLDFIDISTLPPLPDAFDRVRTFSVDGLSDFKADYQAPMAGGAQLKAGWELQIDDTSSLNHGVIGAASPTAPDDPAQTDRFHFRRQVDMLYATWQQPIGKLTVLAGVRGEQSRVNVDDATSAVTQTTDHFRLYPSLNLTYQIDDAQQLSASYSQRVERPNPGQFDPFLYLDGPFYAHVGNPNLRDQISADYEAGYQYKAGGRYYLATLYYKDNRYGVTSTESVLPNGVLLASFGNLTSSRSGGLELVANGSLLIKSLTYNVSADLHRTEIDAQALGFPNARALTTLSGRASLNWTASPNDLFQASVRGSGKEITPQGFSDLGPLINFGYRRRLSDRLAIFVTAQDAFATYRNRDEVFTPVFRDTVRDRGRTQAAFIGFSYAFGGGAKKDPGFDYNN
ncbi:MAG TPA: TonB-dependent receptor [Caulobacteraceae bacterium]|nr:TonB-dependent receptor [Caulobacteraceae bacterium]